MVLTWPLYLSLPLHPQINDDKAHPTSLGELPDDSAWTRKMITHSILYNFADFMTDAIRAMNYMKIKLMKSIMKENGWLSKHEHWIVWGFVCFLILFIWSHIYLFIYLLQLFKKKSFLFKYFED